jgi:hypothetical protein
MGEAVGDGVMKRVILLYGAYALVHDVVFLIGYYLLPVGFLRGGPASAAADVVASAPSFAAQLALTLAFNLGVVAAVGVGLNLLRVRDLPLGYVYPLAMGVMTGLVTGTDSFLSPSAMQMPLRAGLAAGLSIGGVEMFGYVCIIAATAGLGLYRYESWWRLTGTRIRRLRELRLSRSELLVLVLGVTSVVVAACIETLDAWHA